MSITPRELEALILSGDDPVRLTINYRERAFVGDIIPVIPGVKGKVVTKAGGYVEVDVPLSKLKHVWSLIDGNH